jgi:hypothetical protein
MRSCNEAAPRAPNPRGSTNMHLVILMLAIAYVELVTLDRR